SFPTRRSSDLHQRRVERLLRHGSLCRDKICVCLSYAFLHCFPQFHVFLCQIQKLTHQLIPLILQQFMSADCSDQFLFQPGQLHPGGCCLCHCHLRFTSFLFPVLSRRYIVLVQVFVVNPFQLTSRQDAQQLPSDLQCLLDGTVCGIPLADIFLLEGVGKLRIQKIR